MNWIQGDGHTVLQHGQLRMIVGGLLPLLRILVLVLLLSLDMGWRSTAVMCSVFCACIVLCFINSEAMLRNAVVT